MEELEGKCRLSATGGPNGGDGRGIELDGKLAGKWMSYGVRVD